ncbi:hypothetical protein [Streptomyces sp. KL110A]|uniref:hypothetical protein n=1 Tax=Streptomyces sp. KL110A TaxID=3384221 RepID=UPI0038C85046
MAWQRSAAARAVSSYQVEGEGAQGPLQVVGEGEVVAEPGRGGGAAGAGGAAGGLQEADGVVGAERAGQSAAVAGEVGEAPRPVAKAWAGSWSSGRAAGGSVSAVRPVARAWKPSAKRRRSRRP